MSLYESAALYVDSAVSMIDRIDRIDRIIAALENLMLVAAENTSGGASSVMIDEYSLNDGQSTIRTKYRDVLAIAGSIERYDLIRRRLIARLNNNTTGSIIRLVDEKNFRGPCN